MPSRKVSVRSIDTIKHKYRTLLKQSQGNLKTKSIEEKKTNKQREKNIIIGTFREMTE